MKKFSFPLETVLSYKDQVLDNLRNEHSLILQELHAQEEVIEKLREKYENCVVEFNEEKHKGITINKITTYEYYLENLTFHIKQEQEVLKIIKKKEEIKRQQVIEAKTETASLEKLKEKKFKQYEKDVQKSDEQFIDEFVSHARVCCMAR